MSAAPPGSTPAPVPGGIWERFWFWVLLALAATLPIFVPPFPLMPDHISHMARYYIMNEGADSPFLSRYYAQEWRLMGNLGVDLLMIPLSRLLPTEAAATLAVALIPFLTVLGIHSLASTLHGRVPAAALFGLMTIYTYTFIFGFTNYHLSLALALFCVATWIRLAEAPAGWRWLVMVPFACLIWVCHIAGWGAMGLIVLGWELGRAFPGQRPPGTIAGSITRRLASIVLRMLPLALPIILMVIWRNQSGDALGIIYPIAFHKLQALVQFLRAEVRWLDLALTAALALALLWLFVAARGRLYRGMIFAAGLLLAAYLALPIALFGSYFADQRVLPVVVLSALLAIPKFDTRTARLVAIIALSLFSVRLTEISIGWWQRSTAMQGELAALDRIPIGSRIAAFSTLSNCNSYPLHGYDHLASMAIIRRQAFVTTQWDMPGAQLVRPVYNQGRGYNNADWVRIHGPGGSCNGRHLAELLNGLPQDRFDFVWLFNTSVSRPWLQPVFTGPRSTLYRIVRPSLPR